MKAHSLRPAFFAPATDYPEDKKHQRTTGKSALEALMRPVMRVALPAYYTPIPELTAATLAIAQGKYPDVELFRNTDIRKIAKELGATQV